MALNVNNTLLIEINSRELITTSEILHSNTS